MAKANQDNRRQYVSELNEQIEGLSAAKIRAKESEKKKALKKFKEKASRATQEGTGATGEAKSTPDPTEVDDSIFTPVSTTPVPAVSAIMTPSLAITPATSNSLL